MELNSKIPPGPLAEKWDQHQFDIKLVNPANKRKYSVIVVGSGLAGASAQLVCRRRPRRSTRSSTTTPPDAYERLVDRLLASPALRRALGPALARPGPLRRHQRLREGPRRARSGRTATGSSTRSTPTCRSTSSRSSNSPATCCPNATLDQQHRHRLPPQHDAQRGRRHRPAGVPLLRHGRPRRHHRHRLARPDDRLRPVPHAQVRPDHAHASTTGSARSSTTPTSRRSRCRPRRSAGGVPNCKRR